MKRFTLIELFMVCAVIAILAGIIIPKVIVPKPSNKAAAKEQKSKPAPMREHNNYGQGFSRLHAWDETTLDTFVREHPDRRIVQVVQQGDRFVIILWEVPTEQVAEVEDL